MVMRATSRRRCNRRKSPRTLSALLPFLLSIGLSMSASAQQFSGPPTTISQPTNAPTSTPLSTTVSSPSGTSSGTDSDSTRFALIGSSSTPTSSAAVPTGSDDAPPLTPATSHPSSTSTPSQSTHGSGSDSDSDSDSSQDVHASLLNYYFIFLALFVVLLLAGIWLVHRRKKKRKARFRESGADALARDLESAGWGGNARRWMQGVAPWRIGADGQMACSREEGLNELGEAPPPYKQPDGRVRRTPSGREMPATTDRIPEEPSIPLRTLGRDESDRPMKPPGYEESIRGSYTRPYGEGSRPSSFNPSLGVPSPGLHSPSTESLAHRPEEHGGNSTGP